MGAKKQGHLPLFFIETISYKKKQDSYRFVYHKGTNSYGNREILRLNIYPEESTNTWRDFLDSHKNRDLYGTLLVTSDAHGGIKVALQKKLPEAAR